MAKGRKANEVERALGKAQNAAADALLQFPADPEKIREEFINIPSRLKSAAQSAAGEMGSHKKRLQELYRVDPVVLPMVARLQSLPAGRQAAAWRQLAYLARVLSIDPQLDLFNDSAVGQVEPDNGSVFDKTGSGERHAAERGDDPGRARRRQDEAPPVAPPSPAISLDDARAAFEANAHKAPRVKTTEELEAEKEAADAQRAEDAAAFEGGDSVDRLRATLKAEKAPRTRKPKPDVAAKADKYVAQQEQRLGPPSPPPAPVNDDLDAPPPPPAAPPSPIAGANGVGTYTIVN
jgi:hypothetical protein